MYEKVDLMYRCETSLTKNDVTDQIKINDKKETQVWFMNTV